MALSLFLPTVLLAAGGAILTNAHNSWPLRLASVPLAAAATLVILFEVLYLRRPLRDSVE